MSFRDGGCVCWGCDRFCPLLSIFQPLLNNHARMGSGHCSSERSIVHEPCRAFIQQHLAPLIVAAFIPRMICRLLTSAIPLSLITPVTEDLLLSVSTMQTRSCTGCFPSGQIIAVSRTLVCVGETFSYLGREHRQPLFSSTMLHSAMHQRWTRNQTLICWQENVRGAAASEREYLLLRRCN